MWEQNFNLQPWITLKIHLDDYNDAVITSFCLNELEFKKTTHWATVSKT